MHHSTRKVAKVDLGFCVFAQFKGRLQLYSSHYSVGKVMIASNVVCVRVQAEHSLLTIFNKK